jgi:hypothetical protein
MTKLGRSEMKKYIKILLFVLLFAGMTVTTVYAQSEDGTVSGSDVQALLLPLIAAATVVERLIEVIFDWYESAVMQLSKFPGLASEYVAWTQKQVQDCKDAFKDSMTQLEVSKAEQALKDAQDRLASFVKNPQYLSIKRAYSMILGFVFGLIIAFSVEGLALFDLLGLGLPEGLTWVDKLVTGLLIGTGSAPMHSLIGLLQNTKDAVDSARALWKGEALMNAIEFEATAEDIRQLRREQAWMRENFTAMAAVEAEPEAAALAEGVDAAAAPSILLPKEPEVADTPVQVARRAERLISK